MNSTDSRPSSRALRRKEPPNPYREPWKNLRDRARWAGSGDGKTTSQADTVAWFCGVQGVLATSEIEGVIFVCAAAPHVWSSAQLRPAEINVLLGAQRGLERAQEGEEAVRVEDHIRVHLDRGTDG